MSEIIQIFFCEVCKAKLIIPFESDIDVFFAIQYVAAAHHDVSPNCRMPVESLRLIEQ